MDMRLETLIYDNYKRLNENDKHIWSYILNNKKSCESMSIQELACSCNVSHTTILRFAQKLGLNGYSELKFYLKLDNNKKYDLEKVNIMGLSDDINRTMDMLIQRDYSDLFSLLDNSDRIYAYGSGQMQKSAVEEFKRNFLSMNKLVNIIEGSEEVKSALNYITENDVVFLFSHSGENKFMNSFAENLKNNDIRIVSISKSGNNTLSKLSDINIQFYARELAQIGENLPIFSGSQFFIICEILLLKYLEYKKLK